MRGIRALCVAMGFSLFFLGVGFSLNIPRVVKLKCRAGIINFNHLRHAGRYGCDRCHHVSDATKLTKLIENSDDERYLKPYFRCSRCHDAGTIRWGCRQCHQKEWSKLVRDMCKKLGFPKEAVRDMADREVPVSCGGCHRGRKNQARLLLETLP